MPWKLSWIEPEVFIDYRGVKIYHTYTEGNIENPKSRYIYTLDPKCGNKECFCSGECEKVFHIKKIKAYDLVMNKIGFASLDQADTNREILITAISLYLWTRKNKTPIINEQLTVSKFNDIDVKAAADVMLPMRKKKVAKKQPVNFVTLTNINGFEDAFVNANTNLTINLNQ